MLVAVFIMYVILGILYESYIHPLTVLTTLPPAAFGGLLTLYIFGSELSLYAYIGIFMLLGIVSKNGIMMVDFAQQNMGEGMKGFEAMHNACLIRFRPILMTGLSTIMGALPIAVGLGADAAARRPLGLMIVGGLAFAQVITLFITPCVFLYMQSFQEKFLDRFELTRSVAARAAADDPGLRRLFVLLAYNAEARRAFLFSPDSYLASRGLTLDDERRFFLVSHFASREPADGRAKKFEEYILSRFLESD
jgi:predicted RND superfamily exporter protein